MIDDPLPFEKVPLDEAKKALDHVKAPAKVEESDWRWARKWSPPEPLKDATTKWLLAIPPQQRPLNLPQAYPRIANRICDLWNDVDVCERYFDELLTDRRGRRRGFPADVLADLKALRQLRAQKLATNVWDTEATRRR
jgi:hypothetical protein